MGDLEGFTETLDEMVSLLKGSDWKYEIKKLQAIQEWALQRLGVDFGAGDKVVMIESCISKDGWASAIETMVAGATATVTRIDFNSHWKYWYADIVFDREWTVGTMMHENGEPHRYWHGPYDETPPGMEPPCSYDRDHYPEGRKHTFAMPVEYLAKVIDPIPESET